MLPAYEKLFEMTKRTMKTRLAMQRAAFQNCKEFQLKLCVYNIYCELRKKRCCIIFNLQSSFAFLYCSMLKIVEEQIVNMQMRSNTEEL